MLKSLEIFGFKSFADKTKFDLSPGITAVVGPNGSGKSNVVDALKWILGDQSAKSLRGKEMTDVIFNGSGSRKPSGFAEATLTFDNRLRLLPLDMDEVRIGRRIWRNGDAEYLLNDNVARLKDVKDLFLGTGAGSAAYSIIEQGRVDQILQANPANRRAVFEEAAGISRFKARRVESERKLERVAQNLLRLQDIVDEVESQLTAMRSQAAKAAKYREITQELQVWWRGLAADDLRQIREEIRLIESKNQGQAAIEASLAEQQQQLEQEEHVYDSRLNTLDEQIRDIEQQVASRRQSIASLEATVTQQSLRLDELTADISKLQDQRVRMTRRTQDAEREFEDLIQRIVQLEDEEQSYKVRIEQQSFEWETSTQGLRDLREQLESRRQLRLELTRAASSAASQVTMLETRLTDSQAKTTDCDESLHDLGQRLCDQREVVARCQAALNDALTRQQSIQESFLQRQLQRQDIANLHRRAQERLGVLREQRSAAAARKSILEDMERRQEGLGIGTKEILSRASSSTSDPWRTVLGTVSDLLDVDLERAALLEMALGNRAQLIVLRELQSFIDYLQQGATPVSGRVGFVAIPDRAGAVEMPAKFRGKRLIHCLPPEHLLPDLTGLSGVLYRADDLVQSDRGIQGLAAAVLGDTWIVDTLETAFSLSVQTGVNCRFVTLQGELVEPNGVLHVGTARNELSIVTRKSELRRLRVELTQLDTQLADEEAALSHAVATLSGADTELAAAAQLVEEANHAVTVGREQSIPAQRLLEQMMAEHDDILLRSKAQQDEFAVMEEQVEQAKRVHLERAAQLNHVERELVSFEAELQRAESLAHELDQLRQLEQLDLAKQKERIESLRIQRDRAQEEVVQRHLQAEEASGRIDQYAKKRAEISLLILNSRQGIAEQCAAAEGVVLQSRLLLGEKRSVRQERQELTDRQNELRRTKRRLEDEKHAGEMRLRELNHQLDVLRERMEEELQCSLDDLAAKQISAQAIYQIIKPGTGSNADLHAATSQVEQAMSEQNPGNAGAVAINMEARAEIDAYVQRLRRKLKMLGHVNTESLTDLDQLETRYEQLRTQLQDLIEAKNTLEDIIRRINAQSKKMFITTFETVRSNFQDLFRRVFGGGEGDIILEDPEDVLECGIDIKARPPGKELRSLSLLSGGEKTMTAIALIMSIFRAKPSPYCILDEVDAALDEANVERFTSVVRAFQDSTQFVMITHHKRSMVVADMLYGVTMEESGVSKRMSVRFEDVSEDGHIRVESRRAA